MRQSGIMLRVIVLKLRLYVAVTKHPSVLVVVVVVY